MNDAPFERPPCREKERGGRSDVVGIAPTDHFHDHSLQQFVNNLTNRAVRFHDEAFGFEGKPVGIIRAACAARQLETLGESLDALIDERSLGNDRHQKLNYELAGAPLENEPFWPCIKVAFAKGSAIVHTGAHANKAAAALQAASNLAMHRKQT
jgi:hypothetical protein